jgi:hypothetical protein
MREEAGMRKSKNKINGKRLECGRVKIKSNSEVGKKKEKTKV